MQLGYLYLKKNYFVNFLIISKKNQVNILVVNKTGLKLYDCLNVFLWMKNPTQGYP